MYKFTTFQLLICLWAIGINAQAVPEFEMQVFVEDALGNKDTVEVGYQRGLFGDYPYDGPDLTTPLDSVFEVRVFQQEFYNNYTPQNVLFKKRVISGYEHPLGYECGVGQVMFVVSCKYPPITVRYDSTLFSENGCRDNSFLTPDWQPFLVEYWWNTDNYHCMGVQSQIQLDITQPNLIKIGQTLVEGSTIPQDVPGFILKFDYYGPCFTSTTHESDFDKMQVKARPNPAGGSLNLSWQSDRETDTRISLMNALGQIEKMVSTRSETGQNTLSIDTEGLRNGYYIVEIMMKGTRSVISVAILNE